MLSQEKNHTVGLGLPEVICVSAYFSPTLVLEISVKQ